MGYAAAQTTIFRVVCAPAVTNACHPMELENRANFSNFEDLGEMSREIEAEGPWI